MDLTPGAHAVVASAPDHPVIATAHPFGAKAATALGVCELRCAGTIIGSRSVRSVHIARPAVFRDRDDTRALDHGRRPTNLVEMMAVRAGAPDESLLYQSANSALNNDMGIVHGGAAATGLELVVSAALNAGRDTGLQTAALRVNFLRQLLCGDDSRYIGSVLGAGQRSAVADAQATRADGKVALTARVTAYR